MHTTLLKPESETVLKELSVWWDKPMRSIGALITHMSRCAPSGGWEVVDDDADMIHSLDRHVPGLVRAMRDCPR